MHCTSTQVAYTAESLAAQIKNPQDRLEIVSKQIADAVGAKILSGGYSYGEYDVLGHRRGSRRGIDGAVASPSPRAGPSGREDHACSAELSGSRP